MCLSNSRLYRHTCGLTCSHSCAHTGRTGKGVLSQEMATEDTGSLSEKLMSDDGLEYVIEELDRAFGPFESLELPDAMEAATNRCEYKCGKRGGQGTL